MNVSGLSASAISLESEGRLGGNSLLREKTFLQGLSYEERMSLLRGATAFRSLPDKQQQVILSNTASPASSASYPYDIGNLATPSTTAGLGASTLAPNDSISFSMPQTGTGAAQGPGAGYGDSQAAARDRARARASLRPKSGTIPDPLPNAELGNRTDYLYEVARLHTQSQSMQAENRALRDHAKKLVKQVCELQSVTQQESVRHRSREEGLATEAAARIASLEDQLERHKRALEEVAKASENLTNDNAGLSSEVARLRDARDDRERAMADLTDRLRGLEQLYLKGVEATTSANAAATVNESVRQRFWREVVGSDVLEASQPPEGYPVPVMPPTQDAILMLQENAALRKNLDRLTAKNRSLEEELDRWRDRGARLEEQVFQERRAARDLTSKLQSQLLGAVRRLYYLTEERKKDEERYKERERYIRKLEDQLLAQHRAVQSLKKRLHDRADRGGPDDTIYRTGPAPPPPPSEPRASNPGSAAASTASNGGGGGGGGGSHYSHPSSHANSSQSSLRLVDVSVPPALDREAMLQLAAGSPGPGPSPGIQRTEAIIRRAQEASERLATSLFRILHPHLDPEAAEAAGLSSDAGGAGGAAGSALLADALMARLDVVATTSGEVAEAMAGLRAALELSQMTLPASGDSPGGSDASSGGAPPAPQQQQAQQARRGPVPPAPAFEKAELEGPPEWTYGAVSDIPARHETEAQEEADPEGEFSPSMAGLYTSDEPTIAASGTGPAPVPNPRIPAALGLRDSSESSGAVGHTTDLLSPINMATGVTNESASSSLFTYALEGLGLRQAAAPGPAPAAAAGNDSTASEVAQPPPAAPVAFRPSYPAQDVPPPYGFDRPRTSSSHLASPAVPLAVAHRAPSPIADLSPSLLQQSGSQAGSAGHSSSAGAATSGHDTDVSAMDLVEAGRPATAAQPQFQPRRQAPAALAAPSGGASRGPLELGAVPRVSPGVSDGPAPPAGPPSFSEDSTGVGGLSFPAELEPSLLPSNQEPFSPGFFPTPIPGRQNFFRPAGDSFPASLTEFLEFETEEAAGSGAPRAPGQPQASQAAGRRSPGTLALTPEADRDPSTAQLSPVAGPSHGDSPDSSASSAGAALRALQGARIPSESPQPTGAAIAAAAAAASAAVAAAAVARATSGSASRGGPSPSPDADLQAVESRRAQRSPSVTGSSASATGPTPPSHAPARDDPSEASSVSRLHAPPPVVSVAARSRSASTGLAPPISPFGASSVGEDLLALSAALPSPVDGTGAREDLIRSFDLGSNFPSRSTSTVGTEGGGKSEGSGPAPASESSLGSIGLDFEEIRKLALALEQQREQTNSLLATSMARDSMLAGSGDEAESRE